MKYKTEHGHCNIPQWFIGEVATRQREVYRKCKISEERVQKLDHLGFDWTSEPGLETVAFHKDKDKMGEHSTLS